MTLLLTVEFELPSHYLLKCSHKSDLFTGCSASLMPDLIANWCPSSCNILYCCLKPGLSTLTFNFKQNYHFLWLKCRNREVLQLHLWVDRCSIVITYQVTQQIWIFSLINCLQASNYGWIQPPLSMLTDSLAFSQLWLECPIICTNLLGKPSELFEWCSVRGCNFPYSHKPVCQMQISAIQCYVEKWIW